MDKKISVLFIIGIAVFLAVILIINAAIKKYGTEPLSIKPSKTEGVVTISPQQEGAVLPQEEPERDLNQTTGGPLLY